MIDLEIKDNKGNMIIHKLGEGKHVLGKSIVSDIVLMDFYASRHHADLIVTDNKIVMIDFNSTNGVWVNDVRASAKTVLEYGIPFRMGRLKLSIKKSIYNYSVKAGHPYTLEDIDIYSEAAEKAKVLDLNEHRELKKKAG